MRIVELCSAFKPSSGGLERCVLELSTRFAREGHQVTVVTSTRGTGQGPYRETLENVRVIRFNERFHFFEAPLIPEIAMETMTLDYDLLHVHGMSPTITDLGVLAGWLRKKPVVVTYHNDIESDYGGRLGRIFRNLHNILSAPVIGLSDVVVATTYSYGATSPVLRDLKNGFRVIPLGVDAEKFDSPPLPAIGRSERRILFVGQLKDYKGVNYLIEAVGNLKALGYLVFLDIVGTGPSASKLKERTRAIGLDDRVTFWGHIGENKLSSFYSNSDMVVLPSVNRREAFGIVLLEAIASGKRIVASDIPGVREVAMEGGGTLARPGDVESLQKAILASFIKEVDSSMLQRVAYEHSWDRVASEYLSLFESLVPAS